MFTYCKSAYFYTLKRILTILAKPKVRLVLVSCSILDLELSLIRFIPAYIRYLGYFTNFILLGSFLGIGLGCLLADKKINISIFLPVLLLLLVTGVKLFKFEVQITSSQTLYFKSNSGDSLIESYILLPGIFLMVTLIFMAISQNLGRLLTHFSPLTAYSWDLAGSIIGIILFTIGAFLNTPPVVWFGIFTFIYLLSTFAKSRQTLIAGILLFISTFLTTRLDTLPTIWSPYQKIAAYSVSNPLHENDKPNTHWRLYVNNISHQEMTPYSEVANFYTIHYGAWPHTVFKSALIVGSGSGQDVNVALHQGINTIDAVEIDPTITNLGKLLHPDRPYADPRVTLFINDARSFLENTNKRYDLVIFALPDSTILSTSLSNLRLESFLFTTDAFAQVRTHLTPDGIFVLYNFYRTQWLVDKIAVMLTQTFNQTPVIARFEDNLAVFMIGPKLHNFIPTKPFVSWKGALQLEPATDNWPFLYLNGSGIPNIYIKSLMMILFIGMGLWLICTRGRYIQSFAPDFFFLGAAFLLIETKAIVNFNLLFGATWLVNSLVFLGILLCVLLAIVISRLRKMKLTLLMFLLFISLFLEYATPLTALLLPNAWIRYGLATIFFFAPILLANVIFSTLFKKSDAPAHHFGANLIGAFVGGTGEYFSLLLGYRNLILIAIIFYALAFIFAIKRKV